jgi:hypothetical protein
MTAAHSKICLHVTTVPGNFQPLNNRRMLHVHINRGKSDKRSSFSNHVKGYERAFVVGRASIECYREGARGSVRQTVN